MSYPIASTSPSTEWSATALKQRLRILGRARHELALATTALVDALAPDLPRHRADSMAAEVLPVLAACQFLEREAETILKPRRPGRKGLPFWLRGVESWVERVPFGHVLIIGPSNYPLLLPGVQTLQALAAGNRVTWKPGAGGRAVALVFQAALERAGLPGGVLRVTGESVAEGEQALAVGADKIFFTGSASTGRKVSHAAAESLTPVVMELSGADAVFVLPGADVERVIDGLTLGMRLNGSQTCMAPRRLMLTGEGHEHLLARLRERFAEMDAVAVREPVRSDLGQMLLEAASQGAEIVGSANTDSMRPVLVLNGKPEMRVARSDVFAPVLTVLSFASIGQALEADQQCPYGLTATIFGDTAAAERLATRLNVGTVLINDVIVPTVDPRVPFAGRRMSGSGVTRGAEGLLEMTAVRVRQLRRGKDVRHFQPPSEAHAELFAGVIAMSHEPGMRARMSGLRRMIRAAGKIGRQEKQGRSKMSGEKKQ